MAHRALERTRQLGNIHLHGAAQADAGQIAFKHLGHDVHGLRIAHQEQRGAGLHRGTHDGLALGHDAGARRAQHDAVALARTQQRRRALRPRQLLRGFAQLGLGGPQVDFDAHALVHHVLVALRLHGGHVVRRAGCRHFVAGTQRIGADQGGQHVAGLDHVAHVRVHIDHARRHRHRHRGHAVFHEGHVRRRPGHLQALGIGHRRDFEHLQGFGLELHHALRQLGRGLARFGAILGRPGIIAAGQQDGNGNGSTAHPHRNMRSLRQHCKSLLHLSPSHTRLAQPRLKQDARAADMAFATFPVCASPKTFRPE